MYQAAVAGALADDAARRGRRDVPHAAARTTSSRSTPRPGGSSGSTGTTLDPTQIVCCGANNRGARDSRRHAVHGHARRASRRDRRADRTRRCGIRRSPSSKGGYSVTLAPLVVKDKVIVGVGGGELRHSRIHRRLRRADRQGSVALLHDSRAGRARRRHVEGVPAQDRGRVLRSRGVEARRRIDLGDRLVRSRAESHVLGRRQRRSRLEPTQRPGDNLYTDSVVALDADTGKLKWHFPVHAARSRTTTTRCRCRCSPTSTGTARR